MLSPSPTSARPTNRHEAEVAALYEILADLSLANDLPPSECTMHLLGRMGNWIEQGNKEQYPPCCIRQFVVDMLVLKTGNGRRATDGRPTDYRDRTFHPVRRYVMCDQCARHQKTEEPC